MRTKFRGRITYNRVRLSLFLHSHCTHVIAKLLETKNYKQNTQSINRLSQILNLNLDLLRNYFISSKYPHKVPKPKNIVKYIVERKRVFIYLEIEKEILNLMLEKQDWQGTASDDYDKALVEPAIERTAGNHLCNIKNDSEFEEKLMLLETKHRTYYYYVADKYKLPTVRILPFILKLMRN